MEEWELARSVKKFYKRNVDVKAVLYDDGTKYSEKVRSLALLGSTVGGVYSMIMGVNFGGTISASIPRAVYSGLWGAALGGTYITAVHLSATVRQEDSPANHTLGGIATGFMLGIKARSQMVGWRGACLLGTIAYILKDTQKCGGFDAMKPTIEHFTAPRTGRFFTPQGYRNAEDTYDPEQAYTSPVSDLTKIQEERMK